MPIERAAARLIISGLLPTGVSKNMIMRAIRSKGYGYRTQLMIRDIDLLGGRYKNEYYVKKLNVNDVVPQYLMTETDLKRSVKYWVHGEATYTDPFTGEITTKHESFHTDYLRKKGDWSDDYIENFGDRCPGPKPELTNFEIKAVDHNEGFGY